MHRHPSHRGLDGAALVDDDVAVRGGGVEDEIAWQASGVRAIPGGKCCSERMKCKASFWQLGGLGREIGFMEDQPVASTKQHTK